MDYPQNIVDVIVRGGVGVLPTDTIYGIVTQALNKISVERIYKIKDRENTKPFVILVADTSQLPLLSINISEDTKKVLDDLWVESVSVILECKDPNLKYLHRGLETLAVRKPPSEDLRRLISKTGPLVATSANKSGATYKSDMVKIRTELPNLDFYMDGNVGSNPSRLARLMPSGKIEWLVRS
jgi:L-threonylcarbamoyladenylate synthase